jgi:hypothetical protein
MGSGGTVRLLISNPRYSSVQAYPEAEDEITVNTSSSTNDVFLVVRICIRSTMDSFPNMFRNRHARRGDVESQGNDSFIENQRVVQLCSIKSYVMINAGHEQFLQSKG